MCAAELGRINRQNHPEQVSRSVTPLRIGQFVADTPANGTATTKPGQTLQVIGQALP